VKKVTGNLGQLQLNVLGVLAIVVVSTIWSLQTSAFAASPDVHIDIPLGTAVNIEAGIDAGVIPEQIDLQQGASIVLVNEDDVGHRVGGLYASANSTVTARFNEAGSFSYFCSAHPSGQTVFEVAERQSLIPLGWLVFSMLGLLGVMNGFFLGGITAWESMGVIAISALVSLVSFASLAGVVDVLGSGDEFGEGGVLGSNPVSPTADSVDQGKSIYSQFCSTCHGVSTRGDGPLAIGLDPPPADLTVHVPLHPDNVLYQFVQEGIPGSSMPPLGGAISPEETWHLVNYLRTLE